MEWFASQTEIVSSVQGCNGRDQLTLVVVDGGKYSCGGVVLLVVVVVGLGVVVVTRCGNVKD